MNTLHGYLNLYCAEAGHYGRKGQCHCCWWLGSLCRQAINSHDIDCIKHPWSQSVSSSTNRGIQMSRDDRNCNYFVMLPQLDAACWQLNEIWRMQGTWRHSIDCVSFSKRVYHDLSTSFATMDRLPVNSSPVNVNGSSNTWHATVSSLGMTRKQTLFNTYRRIWNSANDTHWTYDLYIIVLVLIRFTDIISSRVGLWICNFLWDEVACLCSNFISALNKSPLNSWLGWVVTSKSLSSYD